MSVLMTVSLPTSFSGTGELSKLDPQTFSDGEILRRLTLSVSSALEEAVSALNKIRSTEVTKGDLSVYMCVCVCVRACVRAAC